MPALLELTLAAIRPVDRSIETAVRAHLDDLTKPLGSLGRLEELALRYCLATGNVRPVMGRKVIFTFAGDHGVAAEGVSAYPAAVTPQMVLNMLAGGAAVSVLARSAGAEVRVVDIGVADPLEQAGSGLVRRKVRPGTASIARGPAMSVDEARRAVEVGVELARSAAAEGATLLGTGDMGIANTTPSSALFAALLPCDPAEVTGRGTGIDDARLAHKVAVIRKALEVNRARLGSPLAALAALGGLEIAGIAGLCLGGAAARVPVVVDGFISSAGALVACRMKPETADYLIHSHLSAEAGHRAVFDRNPWRGPVNHRDTETQRGNAASVVAGDRGRSEVSSCGQEPPLGLGASVVQGLGPRPLLDLGMRLGEGTGAALAMMLVEAALRVYNEMATFSSAGISGKD